ncbi:murein biosynthesis integral membrane protein MurJ [Kitasatospora sp. NPDC085895]|uniref:murein biosynthesis integral membrane protein MurJ n=1 Tax=Kitasatospora sp. NPDC085895 TaxID=3155057 RepID=UPI00344FDBBA
MNTTGESPDSYAHPDPPTMALRKIPPQPPEAGYTGDPSQAAGAGYPGVPAQPGVPPQPGAFQQPGVPPQAPATVPAQRQAEGEAPAAPAASVGRSGLIMALGTLSSRALGFVRSAMIIAALGAAGLGDSFNVANSLPNVVYMMLMGGVLASVFVPELVHAAQTHKDGGVAYTDRLLTLCGVILVVLTVGAWLLAPTIVDLYSNFDGAQRDLTIAFARYCLPQIFFYGVFTLLGQVLNSRDRFGAMMWTPVLNNVVAIAVFGLYILVGNDADTAEQMTTGQTMLLGLGSTLGIVVQAVGLLPSLRSSGFRFRPRFDWRGAGLTKPIRAASWALLLVVVTQLSFAVISRLSTGAGVRAAKDGLTMGLGNFAYTNAYQLFVVPQGVITISLVTALLPGMSRAATRGELTKIGSDLAGMLRSSAAMIVTATVLFIALAPQIADIAYGHGKVTSADSWVIAQTLIAFAIGLPAFCAQYALSRGFYAMGDAKTPFWLTVVSTTVNSGLSAVAYWLLSPRWIIIGMAGAQSIACLVGVGLTGWALGRRLRKPVPSAVPASAPAGPDATMVLGLRRNGKPRSGLDGGSVVALHLAITAACLPGAAAAVWLSGRISDATGGGMLSSVVGLAAGSLAVLVSLFALARPLGAGAAVAPFARKLRIPYPEPAAATGNGKHRR